jgi:hypothetical protein
MRVLQVNISEFRSIDNQKLPAEGQVVLFGPNSAGKTSVLEAAEHFITRVDVGRTDPAEVWQLDLRGSVFFDLPAADMADSADAETYRWLLCGERSDEHGWEWLGEGDE